MNPRLLLVQLTATMALLSATAESDAPLALGAPGPPRRPRGAPADNAACERCHAEIAQEWRSSRHRSSFTNVEFQRALGRERPGARQFCVGCHAPELAAAHDERASGSGVACVTCHVPDKEVLAGPADPERAPGAPSPHAFVRSAAFASPQACSTCHEFRFFDARAAAVDDRAQWMQRTVAEHYDGGGDSCLDCHMPLRAGAAGLHRSHAFPGGHSTELVQKAVEVRAERTSSTAISLTLKARHVTHAVPTGDLFRRIRVSVRAVSKTGAPLGAERFLARHHARHERDQRIEIRDDRLFQQPELVTFELGPGAAGVPIRYRVVYERVDHLVGDDERRAVIAGAIEIASGEL